MADQIKVMKNQITWICLGLLCLSTLVCANPQTQRLRFLYERDTNEIEARFERARLALPPRYITVLRNMAAYYDQKGDTANLAIVNQVLERFVFDPTPAGLMPEQDGPDILLRLQKSYQEEFTASAREREDQLSARQDEYRQALEDLRKTFLQEGQGEDAEEVEGMLAALSPVSMPEPSAASTPEPAAPPAAAPSTENSLDESIAPPAEAADRAEEDSDASSGMTFDDLLEGL